jgi:hypothetical protein
VPPAVAAPTASLLGGMRAAGGSHQQLDRLADNLSRGVAAAFGQSGAQQQPQPQQHNVIAVLPATPVHGPVTMATAVGASSPDIVLHASPPLQQPPGAAAPYGPGPTVVEHHPMVPAVAVAAREGRMMSSNSQAASREPSPVSPTERAAAAAAAAAAAGGADAAGRVRNGSLIHWVNAPEGGVPPAESAAQPQLTSRTVAAVVPVQDASQQVAEWRAQHAVAVVPAPGGATAPAGLSGLMVPAPPGVPTEFHVQWPDPPAATAASAPPAAMPRVQSGEHVAAMGQQATHHGLVTAAPATPSMASSEASYDTGADGADGHHHQQTRLEADAAEAARLWQPRQSVTSPAQLGGVPAPPVRISGIAGVERQMSQTSIASGSGSAGDLHSLSSQTPVPSAFGSGGHLAGAKGPGTAQHDGTTSAATSPHGPASVGGFAGGLPPAGQLHHSGEYHGAVPGRTSEAARLPSGSKPPAAESPEERSAREKKALEQKILLLSSKQLVDMDKSSETLAGKAMKREGSSMSVAAAAAAAGVGSHDGPSAGLQPTRSATGLGVSGHHDAAHIRAMAAATSQPASQHGADGGHAYAPPLPPHPPPAQGGAPPAAGPPSSVAPPQQPQPQQQA